METHKFDVACNYNVLLRRKVTKLVNVFKKKISENEWHLKY